MLEVAIMIEGQDGINWENWQRLATTVEALGFAGLYRSDHFTNANPPDKDSLELWTSLTWLASHTERIEFGPLVSPVSFRDPVLTARIAGQVDDLSGGRLVLGLGAGWQAREHAMFGYDLLDLDARFVRFEEGLEVIAGLLKSEDRFSFDGQYYRLEDAILLPKPQRPGGPPILIGGNGPRRTLPLVARLADEWNGVYLTAEQYQERNSRLDELLQAQGRQPGDVRRSLMTGMAFGRDEAEIRGAATQWDSSPEELAERGLVVGTANAIVTQLGRLAEAGAARVMLQWFALDNRERLEAFAATVLGQL